MTAPQPSTEDTLTTEHVEQPMPTPNSHPSIQSLVRADLEQREQVGIQRYGTALQPHNGRDALRDAYEEALDLACYLKQAMVEREAKAQYFVVTDPDDCKEQTRWRTIPVPGWHVELFDETSETWGRTGWSSIEEMRPYYASIEQVQP